MFTVMDIVQPDTVEEAYSILNKRKTNQVIGGSAFLRMGKKRIGTGIELSKLNLDYIKEYEDYVEIGSMTTFRTLETSSIIKNNFGRIIEDSVKNIIGVQFRNVVTVGATVFSKYGFSDLIVALLSLDTEVELYNIGRISLEEFLNRDYEKDLLIKIYIKKTNKNASYKSLRNAKSDYPILNVSVSKHMEQFKLCVGARPQKATIAKQASEFLSNNEINEINIDKAVEIASEELTFGSNMRASREYRTFKKSYNGGYLMLVKININGKKKSVDIEPEEYLVDTLRKVGNLSVKRGCDTGCCGLCTVLIDKKPTLSCATLTLRALDKEITTIEGLENEVKEFSEVLVKEGAEQCGFCSPGFILTVLAMKDELENPTDDEIKHYLTGNLCRCTGYMGQLRAIKTYLEVK